MTAGGSDSELLLGTGTGPDTGIEAGTELTLGCPLWLTGTDMLWVAAALALEPTDMTPIPLFWYTLKLLTDQ